jgi:hypothetical protein
MRKAGSLRSATGRFHSVLLERETGFEPATSTLARWHSTTELLPQLRGTGLVDGEGGVVNNNKTKHADSLGVRRFGETTRRALRPRYGTFST